LIIRKRCCGYIIITEKRLKSRRFQSNIELKKIRPPYGKLFPLIFVKPGKKSLGSRILRMSEDLFRGSRFNNNAVVYKNDLIRHISCEFHFMSNHDHCHML